MEEQKIIYAFAWYQPEEWQLLKDTVDDPSSLDDCYDDWRKNAEKMLTELRVNGLSVKKTAIKISALLHWCEAKGVKPDSEARSEYASYLIQQKNK